MRFRYTFWFGCLLSLVATGAPLETQQAPRPLSLEDCLRIGLERSISLANARRDQALVRQDVRQFLSTALPSIKGEVRYTKLGDPQGFAGMTGEVQDDAYHAAVTVDQVLYLGGAVRAGLRAGTRLTEATDFIAEVTRRALLLDIGTAYYNILYADAAVTVASNAVTQVEALLRQSEQRFAQGMASEFDVLSASVKVANERPSLAQAHKQAALARSVLRNLLSLDEGPIIVQEGWPTARPFSSDWKALLEQAWQERPEIKAARAHIKHCDERIRVERSNYLPEIRAFARYGGDKPDQYDPTLNEWNWSWQAGVSGTWSFWDSGLRRAKMASKKLEKDKAEASLEKVRQQIRMDVEQAFLTLQQAQEILAGAQSTVAQAERALAIAQTRYEQGLSTQLEFMDAHLALNQARLSWAGAQKDHIQATLALAHASGGDPAMGLLNSGAQQ